MSSIAMAADSTMGDRLKSPVPTQTQESRRKDARQDKRRERLELKRKLKAKARAKLAQLRKRKEVESDVSDHDSDLDLDRPLVPIMGYVKEREVMLEHMFRSISRRKLKAMLPEIIKPVPLDELKKLCLEQLEMMSRKRICRILEGDDPDAISSSGTEEEETASEVESEEEGWNEAHGGVADSTSCPQVLSDEESIANTISSHSDVSDTEDTQQHAIKREVKKEQSLVSQDDDITPIAIDVDEHGIPQPIMIVPIDDDSQDSQPQITLNPPQPLKKRKKSKKKGKGNDLEDGELSDDSDAAADEYDESDDHENDDNHCDVEQAIVDEPNKRAVVDGGQVEGVNENTVHEELKEANQQSEQIGVDDGQAESVNEIAVHEELQETNQQSEQIGGAKNLLESDTTVGSSTDSGAMGAIPVVEASATAPSESDMIVDRDLSVADVPTQQDNIQEDLVSTQASDQGTPVVNASELEKLVPNSKSEDLEVNVIGCKNTAEQKTSAENVKETEKSSESLDKPDESTHNMEETFHIHPENTSGMFDQEMETVANKTPPSQSDVEDLTISPIVDKRKVELKEREDSSDSDVTIEAVQEKGSNIPTSIKQEPGTKRRSMDKDGATEAKKAKLAGATSKGKTVAPKEKQKELSKKEVNDDADDIEIKDEIFDLDSIDLSAVSAPIKEDGIFVSKNQMEILELEMRARAIKAMLKMHEEIEKRERLLNHQARKLKQQQEQLQSMVDPPAPKYGHLTKLEKAKLLAERANQQSEKAKQMKALIARKQAEKLKLNAAVQKSLRKQAKDKDNLVPVEKRKQVMEKVAAKAETSSDVKGKERTSGSSAEGVSETGSLKSSGAKDREATNDETSSIEKEKSSISDKSASGFQNTSTQGSEKPIRRFKLKR